MKTKWIALLTGGVLMHSLAFADVSYQDTTAVTGGSLMGMLKMAGSFSSQAKQAAAPVTSTVMIHGGRMLTSNPHDSEIIDLDQQTITFIDHDKRTYSVSTFQEIQDEMAKLAAKQKGAQPSSSNGPQMSFAAHISSNGATREIDGKTAKEALITLTMVANTTDNSTKAGMAATSEMWLVAEEPGQAEMRRFSERMAKELSFDAEASAMSSLLAAQPGGAQALAELKKESAKMSGVPVLQVTRIGMTVDGQPLPAPSTTPLPQSQGSTGSSAGAVSQEIATGTAEQTAGSQIGRLGTFGRALSSSSLGALMRHTPSTTPHPAAANADPAAATDPATAAILLENQRQSSGFSEAVVDPGNFQIPAGYKAVSSHMGGK